MKAIDKSVIRIRAEDAQAAALWTLPVVKSGHVVALHERVEPPESASIEEDVVADKLTLSELEKIREDAYQEGLAQGQADGLAQGIEAGREQGYQAGIEAGAAEVQARVQALESMLKQLEQPLEDACADVEVMLVDMVRALSRAVVGHELSADPEAVKQAVTDAVAQLPHSSDQLRIMVNPQDMASVQALADLHEHWLLVEDSSMSPGGCRVTTSNTRIDNSVEHRFDAVAEQLVQRLLSTPPTDGGDE